MGYLADTTCRRMEAPAIQSNNAIQLPSWTDRGTYDTVTPILNSTTLPSHIPVPGQAGE
jgi:hypothetical protein